jgi:predicted RNase H-like nuclease
VGQPTERHSDHHFGLYDSGVIASNLTSGKAFAQQPQRLSVIFSSFFKKHEPLLWKRPAGKHRYEVLPTERGLNSSLVEAGVGDLDRIGLPGSQIGSTIVT